MKKLIILGLLICMAFSASAQWYYRTYGVMTLDSLTQGQLKYSYQRASNIKSTGVIMTIVGTGMFVGGYALMITSIGADDWESGLEQGFTGGLLMMGGPFIAAPGIVTWAIGSSRKNQIKHMLLRFEGSANGVGLTIYF